MRRGALALSLALALVAAGRAPLAGARGKPPGDPESTSALQFVHQVARPGDRIDGRVPVLYVNASDSNRVVAIGWKERPADLYLTAHAIAAYGQDSCSVEWIASDGTVVKETWWLDKKRGMIVSRDPRGWFVRTYNMPNWGFASAALGVSPGAPMFSARAVDHAVEAMLEAELEIDAQWKAQPVDSQLAIGDSVSIEMLPEAITRVAPQYPDDARELGESGIVLVEAMVGKDGNVKYAFPVESIPDLDAAALACVEQWKFKPARSGGRAVAVWVRVPVKFNLH